MASDTETAAPPADTGPAAEAFVAAVQSDLARIVGHLKSALAGMRTLEADGKAVRGLQSLMKASGNEAENRIATLEETAAEVPRLLLQESSSEITQSVDGALAADVRRAKES